jgi:rubredoxin
MSELFPWLAVEAADPTDRATGKRHAMGSGLRFAFAQTMCGMEPIDPRESGMPMDQVRLLPRFDDVPEDQKCPECTDEMDWDDED